VSATPASDSVVLGNQVTFAATVTNTTDTTVSWRVNDISGGNSTVGTISSTGVYTAPRRFAFPCDDANHGGESRQVGSFRRVLIYQQRRNSLACITKASATPRQTINLGRARQER
jgi:hypothetical protein